MRKFLAVALAVVMTLALIPTAFAAYSYSVTDTQSSYIGINYTTLNFSHRDENNDLSGYADGASQKALIGWAANQNVDPFRVQLVDPKGTVPKGSAAVNTNATISGPHPVSTGWANPTYDYRTLRIDAQYNQLQTRGNGYERYIDVPVHTFFKQGAIVYTIPQELSNASPQPTGTQSQATIEANANNEVGGRITVFVDGAEVTNVPVTFTAAAKTPAASGTTLTSNAIAQTVTVRYYPTAGGKVSEVFVRYSDKLYGSSSNNFWVSGTGLYSLQDKVNLIYVDRNTLTMGPNDMQVSTVNTNANRSYATWNPDINAVRTYVDFGNLVKQKIYKMDNGTDYFLVETKVILMKDGVPYPGGTPVQIDLVPSKIANTSVQAALQQLADVITGTYHVDINNYDGYIVHPSMDKDFPYMTMGADYWMDIAWENDRVGYLAADGSFNLRFYYKEYNDYNLRKRKAGSDISTPDKKNADLLKKLFDYKIAAPKVFIRENGIYTEKSFDWLLNSTYQVNTAGISIPGGDFELLVGATKQLTVVYGDNYTMDRIVGWTSADPSVATVDAKGLVTAVKAGTTVVKARTSVEGKEAFVIVTVKDNVPVVVTPPVAATTKYVVVCRSLNKRVGPGTSYSKVAPTLKRGDSVLVSEVVGGWAKYEINGVTYYSSTGDGQYLQPAL